MINLTSTSAAVSWPVPPAASTIVPVVAVPPVPALPGGRETQTGPRSGGDGQARAFFSASRGERRGAREEAAPLLPRESAGGQAAGAPAEAEAARRQADQAAHAAREREQQAMQHLKEVLTSVWQASAAVVDRALGVESAPGNQSDTAPDLSQVAASLISRRALPAIASAPGRPAAPPASGTAWVPGREADAESPAQAGPGAPADVVAYDAHGHSSAMPLEAGSLISHRV